MTLLRSSRYIAHGAASSSSFCTVNDCICSCCCRSSGKKYAFLGIKNILRLPGRLRDAGARMNDEITRFAASQLFLVHAGGTRDSCCCCCSCLPSHRVPIYGRDQVICWLFFFYAAARRPAHAPQPTDRSSQFLIAAIDGA